MIPEVGHFALILALSLAICQGVMPILGAYRGDDALMAVARPAARGQFLFVVISFACLYYLPHNSGVVGDQQFSVIDTQRWTTDEHPIGTVPKKNARSISL